MSGTEPARDVPTPRYGRCPICDSPGLSRERRLGGNDTCYQGHMYPSNQAIQDEPAQIQPRPPAWARMLKEIPPFFQGAFELLSAEERKDPSKVLLFTSGLIHRCLEDIAVGMEDNLLSNPNFRWMLRLQNELILTLVAQGKIATLHTKENM